MNPEMENIVWTKTTDSFKIKQFVYSFGKSQGICQGKIFNIQSTCQQETSLSLCLSFSDRKDWVFMPCKLPAGNIKKLQLYRGRKLLKEGKDYFLNKQGAIAGLKPRKAFKAKASFSFVPERYDSVFLDTENGRLHYIQGRERNIDAEEYIPGCPDRYIRLFNILVSGKNFYVFPVCQNENPVKKGDIVVSFKKLKNGENIKICSYGDSISAIQLEYPTYKAGGPLRDRPEIYLTRYPEDTVEKIELYDFNDGAGKVHCKIGWSWFLADFLEKTYMVKTNYLNFGIGGSQSSSGKRNGLYSRRIRAVIKEKPDLTILAFGMNELEDSDTGERISEIIHIFKNSGSDVIVMGVPWLNGNRRDSLKSWNKTNTLLAKAAEENDCPFVDTRKICLGIAPRHMSSANLFNHPGPGELAVYGRNLCRVFDKS